MTAREQYAEVLAAHRMTVMGCQCAQYMHPRGEPMVPSHEAHLADALAAALPDPEQAEEGTVPCPAAVRCPDRTLCPPACQRAGNREGNHKFGEVRP